MKNINQETRRRQNLVMAAVLCGVAGLGCAGWLYFDSTGKKASPVSQDAPAPNMTGVVDENLTGKVQIAAIEEAQRLNKETVKRMKEIENRLSDVTRENNELKDRVSTLQKNNGASSGGATSDDPPAPRLPGTEQDTLVGLDRQTADMRGDTFGVRQPLPPTKITINDDRRPGLRRSTFDYPAEEDATVNGYKFPFIPAGSFSPSITVEGADANASVTGDSNTSPMQLRITGLTNMPNDHTVDLTGCFVTLEAWGDVSSERAQVRTRFISCIIDGETINQEVKGHASFRGKNGIKGEVVMRNGQILGWAWGAGFVDGLGGGLQQMSQTQVGVGATATPGVGDVFKGGLGGGASKAANTLSDYYIKRAEQYHPIIPIGAGNEVELVFNDGFQLKTMREMRRDKQTAQRNADSADRLRDGASEVVYQTKAEARNAAEMAKYHLGDTLTRDDFKNAAKLLPSEH